MAYLTRQSVQVEGEERGNLKKTTAAPSSSCLVLWQATGCPFVGRPSKSRRVSIALLQSSSLAKSLDRFHWKPPVASASGIREDWSFFLLFCLTLAPPTIFLDSIVSGGEKKD